jgi:hypothetical protein
MLASDGRIGPSDRRSCFVVQCIQRDGPNPRHTSGWDASAGLVAQLIPTYLVAICRLFDRKHCSNES